MAPTKSRSSGGSAKHNSKKKQSNVPKRHRSPADRKVDPRTHVDKSIAQWWIFETLTEEQMPYKYEKLCIGTITAYVKKKASKAKPVFRVKFDDFYGGDIRQMVWDNSNVEEHLHLYDLYKSTRGKSIVARDLETKESIEIQSVTRDENDPNLFYSTIVRRVDDGNDDVTGGDDVEDYDETEEELPCCDGCTAKDDKMQQLELEKKEVDKAHARDCAKWAATENEYKHKLDAASEQHARDQSTIATLTQERDDARTRCAELDSQVAHLNSAVAASGAALQALAAAGASSQPQGNHHQQHVSP